MAVSAMESLVAMENPLYPVLSRRNLGNAPQRIAQDVSVDYGRFSRTQAFHVDTENELRV